MKFRGYLRSVRAAGKLAFTINEAQETLGVSKNAIYSGLHKLKQKGEIVSPARQLYVIVPPEYTSLGCLPAEELVPIVMQHWQQAYYVCGLSAAYYHGASHQKPQTFQLMVNRRIKPLICGRIKLTFTYKEAIAEYPLEERVVKTGYLKLATPELTALDILSHYQLAGSLNQAATVLSELIEAMDAQRLQALIANTPHAWWQRLGYILEQLDPMDEEAHQRILMILRNQAKQTNLNWVPLQRSQPTKGFLRHPLWKIMANTTIESDE